MCSELPPQDLEECDQAKKPQAAFSSTEIPGKRYIKAYSSRKIKSPFTIHNDFPESTTGTTFVRIPSIPGSAFQVSVTEFSNGRIAVINVEFVGSAVEERLGESF